MPPNFAIVPVEVCMDGRLSKMQIRVLVALLSFRAKNTDTVWPKRSQIAERCGYDERVITRVTTQLVKLGWLEKVGKGGFSKSCEYRITVPEFEEVPRGTITDSVTVEDEKEVPDSPDNGNQIGNGSQIGNGNQTGANNGNQFGASTVTDSVTGNKHTNNIPISDQYIPSGKNTKWPDNFFLTDRLRENAADYWQSKNRPDLIAQLDEQFFKFENYAKSKGLKYQDWNRAWVTWYSNAVGYTKPPSGHGQNHSQQTQGLEI